MSSSPTPKVQYAGESWVVPTMQTNVLLSMPKIQGDLQQLLMDYTQDYPKLHRFMLLTVLGSAPKSGLDGA